MLPERSILIGQKLMENAIIEIQKCHVPILAFFTNFYPIKIDLSGNTVRPQDFQKLAKIDHFWHF